VRLTKAEAALTQQGTADNTTDAQVAGILNTMKILLSQIDKVCELMPSMPDASPAL
jgi:hypothetical protein